MAQFEEGMQEHASHSHVRIHQPCSNDQPQVTSEIASRFLQMVGLKFPRLLHALV